MTEDSDLSHTDPVTAAAWKKVVAEYQKPLSVLADCDNLDVTLLVPRRRPELAQLFFGQPQRLFDANALGDIAQDYRIELAAGLIELRDRCIDRELLAVAPKSRRSAARVRYARCESVRE